MTAGQFGVSDRDPDQPAAAGDVAAQFRDAMNAAESQSTFDLELLPDHLRAACVRVLGVDGAGLSIVDGYFRVPLGASDDMAGVAERLQFTLGVGPCLEAAQNREPAVVSTGVMQAQWPEFAAQLSRRTRYTGIVSVPLLLDDKFVGALDLYVVRSADLENIPVTALLQVIDLIAQALTIPPVDDAETHDDEFPSGPAWLNGRAAEARNGVWVAVGMLMAALDVPAADGLALLRARAFTQNQEADTVADALVTGNLAPESFRP